MDKLCCRHYSELTRDELFEILRARVDVFVVEQKCPYHEIDEMDKHSYHIWIENENGIQACLRLIEREYGYDEVRIGRVLALKRHCGYATRIVKAAVDTAREVLGADRVVLEAQVYAKSLYEKLGFRTEGEVFLEDGIPHIRMELDL